MHHTGNDNYLVVDRKELNRTKGLTPIGVMPTCIREYYLSDESLKSFSDSLVGGFLERMIK